MGITNGIVNSPWPPIEIPHIALHNFILERLHFHGDESLITESSTGKQHTFNELAYDSLKLANGLLSIGIKEDDHLAVCGPNSYEMAVCIIGGLIAGAVIVPIKENETLFEISGLLNRRKVKFLATSCELAIKISQTNNNGSLKGMIILNRNNINNNFHSFSKLLSSEPIDEYLYGLRPHHVIDKVCFIMETNETSDPMKKGSMLSHLNIVTQLSIASLPLTGVNWNDHDTIINGSSYSSINGIVQLFLGITVGAKIVILNQNQENSIDLFVNSVDKYQVTAAMISLQMINTLLKMDVESNLRSLKKVICSGYLLNKTTSLKFVNKFKIDDFRQGYAKTELCMFVTLEHVGSKVYESVGVPLQLNQIKIVDRETKQTLQAGQKGEICVRSPQMFQGYHEHTLETNDVLDNEGWFHTGDIGYYDLNDRIYITDRIKNVIQSDGYCFSCSEIETVLMSHPAVQEAAAIGIPDEVSGELPAAFVVLKSQYRNGKVTAEELTGFVNDRVTKWKRLRGGLYLLQNIPRTEYGNPFKDEMLNSLNQSHKTCLIST